MGVLPTLWARCKEGNTNPWQIDIFLHFFSLHAYNPIFYSLRGGALSGWFENVTHPLGKFSLHALFMFYLREQGKYFYVIHLQYYELQQGFSYRWFNSVWVSSLWSGTGLFYLYSYDLTPASDVKDDLKGSNYFFTSHALNIFWLTMY